MAFRVSREQPPERRGSLLSRSSGKLTGDSVIRGSSTKMFVLGAGSYRNWNTRGLYKLLKHQPCRYKLLDSSFIGRAPTGMYTNVMLLGVGCYGNGIWNSRFIFHLMMLGSKQELTTAASITICLASVSIYCRCATAC